MTREGARHAIDARDVVPGDIVSLEPGDKVPADLRVVRARSLLVNEAILTLKAAVRRGLGVGLLFRGAARIEGSCEMAISLRLMSRK